MPRTKIIEAAINYTNVDNCAYFSSNDKRWISRIFRLKREYPELVDIQQVPDNNGGYIMAGVPKDWFKLTPPRKHNLTDNQRNELRERVLVARQAKSSPTE